MHQNPFRISSFWISRSFFAVIVFFCALVFPLHQIFAAGNIVPSDNLSQFLHLDLNSDSIQDRINWNPTNGGATVGDSSITGYIWGETVGWINLNPTNGGVTNDCSGTLGGYAWGQNTGWINFAPTNGGVSIDTSTGVFSGYAWSANYGWIKFDTDSSDTNDFLETTWHGCGGTTATTAGTTGISGCTDPAANNYDSSATIDNGSCTYGTSNGTTGIGGCTDSNAKNYNSLATFDDGSCIYPPQLCEDPQANNQGDPLPCTYPPQLCTDKAALNYGDALPCQYDHPVCLDHSANNYGDAGTCKYPPQLCEDPQANNQGDPLPCTYPPPPPDTGTGTGGTTPGTTVPTKPYYPPISLPSAPAQNSLPILPIIGYVFAALGILSMLPGLIVRFAGFLFTVFIRRKRLPWGTVYDAVTKEPLDPAYVTATDIATGKEIAQSITDIDGRYGFLLSPGRYRMTANKTNYQFPSAALRGHFRDEVYESLYFGEEFEIHKDDRVVTLNIPMDPIGHDWNQDAKRDRNLFRFFTHNTKLWNAIFQILFLVGFAFSIYAVYYYPTWWNGAILGLYIFFLVLDLFGMRPVTVGTVTNEATGQPNPHAFIRVFSAALGQEIAHRITDDQGKYYLLMPRGKYYVSIETKGNDDTYHHVFTSDTITVKNGLLNLSFKVPPYIPQASVYHPTMTPPPTQSSQTPPTNPPTEPPQYPQSPQPPQGI